MAIAPYILRLSPPRLETPPLPQLLPRLRRSGSAKVAAVGTSWAPAAGESSDGVSGWWVPEHEKPVGQGQRKTGFGIAVPVGLGASAAIALAGLAWQSPSSRNCLQQLVVAPLHYVQEKLSPESAETPNEDTSDREPDGVFSTTPDEKAEAVIDDSMPNNTSVRSHFLFTAPIDPVHEEAFSILKKLQIIEKDVSPSDFCTRREFARWFVKLYSKFERTRMQRIVPNKLTSGSIQSAFDDVNVDDPDFLYIQSLGESGIVPSKISNSLETSTGGFPSCQGNSLFLPESYLSRFDLVNWKLLVEHPRALEIDQKMLNQNVRILHIPDCPDVSPSMLIELMAGENNIISKVFGNTRRLQPLKPVTKAQAAAALTSGRMEEAIRDELNRLEAENQAHLSAIAEIMEELISKGDIQQQWEEKMKKEQQRAFEVDKDLQHVLHELAIEKTGREREVEDLLKEKAALECQNQELINLRSEIDGMYDTLATENAKVMADQQNLENLLSDVTSKHQAVNEAKSHFEAEKEALTMLRSRGSLIYPSEASSI
ncbi:uncharacterized protein LOC120669611 isoform X2 [Panicum virgatum]|uniref:Uncharacterized protein n=1 Tax=Panicum virgatum TaxID=38727 RepID=A0A8T0T5W7_PANVG|nr:uncharacterized protein LOC120669611 isoform X2 [Panicum virgatum]KAG2603786.1 hypothetical protein PVAP13_4NG011500 [Panicum virgatum]